MQLPECGHMSGRNMQEVYGVCSILSYTYVHFLFLISYLIAESTVMDRLKLLRPKFVFSGFTTQKIKTRIFAA